MNKNRFGNIILICLLAVFMATGCASFPGKQLPIYTNSQLPVPAKKISATYDVKAYGIFGEADNESTTRLSGKIEKVLSASSIFSELKPGSGQGDYHYSFVFRRDGQPSMPIAFLNGFICGYTLGIIPAFARDIFIITIDAKQGDHVIKTYIYQDHMDTWFQLFLVFLIPSNFPTSVEDTVVENIVMNFAYDFSSDMRSGVYLAKQN